MSVPVLNGIREIVDYYNGFVLDLWGVIHDGFTVFPGVIDALERLRTAGKKVIFLSNAPRRAHIVAEQLDTFGITDQLHDGIMSSGEATWRYLNARPDDWSQALGRSCLLVGPDRDIGIMEGLDLVKVETVAAADFILVTGPQDQMNSAEPYDTMLREAHATGKRMICANPDREVIRGGVRQICAGAISERYQKLGGEVRWYGKPDPSIYNECFRLLDISNKSDILSIGDSFATDIQGANAAGLDALLVQTGIDGNDLVDTAGRLDSNRIAERADAKNLHLIGAVGAFVW
ncbi:MAG: Phosphoglycolate phosphatase [Alphaproteobacteria bacterium MarineAlpha4_Bin2]|nr:MAG: Phosphoglycolate phosphatase [Alphaproteobacteria bacterium MarineAlpha4_Bin2]